MNLAIFTLNLTFEDWKPPKIIFAPSWFSLMASTNKYVTEEKRVTHTTATELQGYKFHLSDHVLLQI